MFRWVGRHLVIGLVVKQRWPVSKSNVLQAPTEGSGLAEEFDRTGNHWQEGTRRLEAQVKSNGSTSPVRHCHSVLFTRCAQIWASAPSSIKDKGLMCQKQ